MNQIENWIVDLAQKFSGQSNVTLAAKIYSDLGINGSDYVEFFSEIDKYFEVDTRSITEQSNGGPIDPTISQIVEFIERRPNNIRSF